VEKQVVEESLRVEVGCLPEFIGPRGVAQRPAVRAEAQGLDGEAVHGQQPTALAVAQGQRKTAADGGQQAAALRRRVLRRQQGLLERWQGAGRPARPALNG
jgi:hypothetical protein